MSHPTLDQLKRAIEISEKIQKLEAEITAIFGQKATSPKLGRPPGKAAATAAVKSEKKPHKFSDEARAKIATAQKARWAKIKEAKGGEVATPQAAKVKIAKKKPAMSPEGLANIRAAQVARWAKIKETKDAAVTPVVAAPAPEAAPAPAPEAAAV